MTEREEFISFYFWKLLCLKRQTLLVLSAELTRRDYKTIPKNLYNTDFQNYRIKTNLYVRSSRFRNVNISSLTIFFLLNWSSGQ